MSAAILHKHLVSYMAYKPGPPRPWSQVMTWRRKPYAGAVYTCQSLMLRCCLEAP